MHPAAITSMSSWPASDSDGIYPITESVRLGVRYELATVFRYVPSPDSEWGGAPSRKRDSHSGCHAVPVGVVLDSWIGALAS